MLLLIFNKLLLIPFLFWVSHLAEASVSLVTSQRAHFKNSVARTLKKRSPQTIKCCVCITDTGSGNPPTVSQPGLSGCWSDGVHSAPPRPPGSDRHPTAAFERAGPDHCHSREWTSVCGNFSGSSAQSQRTCNTYQTQHAGMQNDLGDACRRPPAGLL